MEIKAHKLKAEFVILPKKTGIDLKILFECEPQKNGDCKRTNCGECHQTPNIHFAKEFDLDG